MERPVRLTQKLTRHEYGISLASSDDLLSLHRLCNKTNSPRGYLGFLPDGRCKWNLESRTSRDFRVRQQSPTGTINQIHAKHFQPAAQLDRLSQIPTALNPVSTRDADKKRQVGWPCLSESFGNA